MNNNYSRRRILQGGGLVGFVLLTGCSSDGTEEQDTPPKDDDNTETTSATETETDKSEEDTETETETDKSEEDNDEITVSDYPYTRWLPASVSTVDGSVNFEMWYVDAAEIRSMKDSLPDSLLSGSSGQFPGEESTPQEIEPSRVDDFTIFRAPKHDESDRGNGARIYLGTFDKQRIVESSLNKDWADSQTEYGKFTVINDEKGDAIGISESVVILAFDPQGARLLETFVDTRAGKIERVHEADSKVARLLEIIRANTFVRVTYGEVYMNRSTQPTPEGILGTGMGWRIGEQETERVLAFPFTDESSASTASDSENFLPRKYGDFELSESVDGGFVIKRQTIPTEELDRFPGL